MSLRLAGCVLVAALLLAVLPAPAQAGGVSVARMKLGASGQVYIWQAGSC